VVCNCGGGCFITTAVCEMFDKPDDCYELTMFRNFRDEYLKKQSDGEMLIVECYQIAPIIVSRIDRQGPCIYSFDSEYRKGIPISKRGV
jgi:hypothetical protein